MRRTSARPAGECANEGGLPTYSTRGTATSNGDVDVRCGAWPPIRTGSDFVAAATTVATDGAWPQGVLRPETPRVGLLLLS